MEIRSRASGSEGRITTNIRHTPYRNGNNRFSLYKFFFHYIKYISHGRLGPYYRCTGAYPTPFSSYSYLMYYLLHFYEHILSHFVISYLLFVIFIISITTMQCVYLFYDMCPVSSLFVMYYDTVHSFSIFFFYIPIWPSMLFSLSA
jgi:hypothetical protein